MTRDEFLAALPELVKNYQPAKDVLEHIGRLNVLMVVGPTGVGKSTLINKMSIKHVLSDNSRLPRPHEVEGVDFYFRSDYDQLASDIKNGRFVQVAIDGGGDFKATTATSYPESGDVVMAVLGEVVPLFRNLGFAKTTTAFIAPPSYEEWMRRVNQHHLSPEAYDKRMAEAVRSFSFALSDPDTHFILSDNIEAAATQLKHLLEGSVDEARENKAKAAAAEILNNLKGERNG